VRAVGAQLLTVLLVLGIAAVTTSALFGEDGVAHLLRLHTEQRELGRAAFTLLQANTHLQGEIRKLRSDDLYLEELARRQLGLVRPGETVYRTRRPGG
jgi:cell division protein FtsB